MKKEKHDHREAQKAQAAFSGYAPPTSSTTYTPNQFFDVVLPRASRGCLRLVAYLVRKTLGWSDEHGNPQNPEATVSYRELIENAGIGRGRIKEAIQEATENRYINCLRFGQPHRAGEEGYSALYSLRWDERESYITDPDEFDGFFAGNGNLTHIPNDFFDYTIPTEPLALVKVVGVIIRNTIGFQTKYGFRRQQVELSFSDIMRKAGIASRSTVNIALKEAVEKNHICKVSEGYFDPRAGAESSAATYGIKWIDQDDTPPKRAVVEFKSPNGSEIEPGGRFQNRTGKSGTVPKSNRGIGSEIEPANGTGIEPGTVPKSNQEGFRNRTDIKTTRLNNLPKQQQHTEGDAAAVGSQELLSAKMLVEAGFDFEAAASLASKHPLETIRRQVEWLPRRKATRNALGLLRKAIEEDWQEPEGTDVQTSEQASRGIVFGGHFYAALAGRDGEPTVAPTAKEATEAEEFLASAEKQIGSLDPAETGRKFGDYVRRNQDEKRGPIRNLGFALRAFGDAFVAKAEEDVRRERRMRIEAAKKAHEAKFAEAYAAYEVSLLADYSEREPEKVKEFESATEARIARMKNMSPRMMESLRERYEEPESRARMFADYLKESGKGQVLGFWDWDKARNPDTFAHEDQSQ